MLDIARKLLLEEHEERDEAFYNKLQQLKNVLEMLVSCVCVCVSVLLHYIHCVCVYFLSLYCRYDHFSGINRKIQFKLLHKDINNIPLPSEAM